VAGQEASSTMQIEERQAPTAATAVMAISGGWSSVVQSGDVWTLVVLRRGRGGLELM